MAAKISASQVEPSFHSPSEVRQIDPARLSRQALAERQAGGQREAVAQAAGGEQDVVDARRPADARSGVSVLVELSRRSSSVQPAERPERRRRGAGRVSLREDELIVRPQDARGCRTSRTSRQDRLPPMWPTPLSIVHLQQASPHSLAQQRPLLFVVTSESGHARFSRVARRRRTRMQGLRILLESETCAQLGSPITAAEDAPQSIDHAWGQVLNSHILHGVAPAPSALPNARASWRQGRQAWLLGITRSVPGGRT